MSRDRDRRRRHSNSNSGNNRRREENSSKEITKDKKPKFKPHSAVSHTQIQSEDEAIKMFKNANQPICSICGKVINDLSSALMERGGADPVHFDCAMDQVSAAEQLGEGDKIAYIGQGRFGVLNYPNIRDVRHFTIKKIIDWEDRNESRGKWRDEMAELFSQIK